MMKRTVLAAVMLCGVSQLAMAQVSYSPPIVITRGGTYTGAWASTKINTPAVTVQTGEPVTIVDSYMRGPGELVQILNSDASGRTVAGNVTIRNSYGYGRVPGRARYRNPRYHYFVDAFDVANVTVENCYTNGLASIRVLGFTHTPGQSGTVTVRYNRAQNVQGGFISFVDARDLANATISWNEVINQLGQAVTGDTINIYQSSGVAESPIDISNNLLFGLYYSPNGRGRVNAAALNASDQSDQPDAVPTSYVRAHHNQIARTDASGPSVSAGNNIELDNNRIVSSGVVSASGTSSDGLSYNNPFSYGVVIRDFYGNTPPGSVFNNSAHDNVVGYVHRAYNSRFTERADLDLTSCGNDQSAQPLCYNNQSLPGPITPQLEFAEYQAWLAKLAANRVVIGPSIAPDPAFPAPFAPQQ